MLNLLHSHDLHLLAYLSGRVQYVVSQYAMPLKINHKHYNRYCI